MFTRRWQTSRRQYDIVHERNVAIPVRAGFTLDADVLRPKSAERFPLILCMFPFDKDLQLCPVKPVAICPELVAAEGGDYQFYVRRGYAQVFLNVCGTGRSGGEFDHLSPGIIEDLYDVDTQIMDEPPIHLFVQNISEWRAAHEWPLPETRWTEFYLHRDGLLFEHEFFPDDECSRLVESPDVHGVLDFRTPRLVENTEIIGPLVLNFWASTSDTEVPTAVLLKAGMRLGLRIKATDRDAVATDFIDQHAYGHLWRDTWQQITVYHNSNHPSHLLVTVTRGNRLGTFASGGILPPLPH